MVSSGQPSTVSNVQRTAEERFADLPDFPYEPHYREWEGIRLAHIDEGEGQPVVMLHGEPSWSFLYRKLIPPLLAAGFRTIAADLPGFGRSDKPTDEDWYSYDRHTDAIASLLVDLDLRDVCMVMHDWGGPIGLRVSMLEVPERVSRLVVMDAGVLTGTQEMGPTWRAFRDLVRQTPDFPIARMVRLGCRVKPSKEVLAAYDAPFPDSVSKAGARAFPKLIPLTPEAPSAKAGRETLEALSSDKRAALLLWADSDPMFPLEKYGAETHDQFGHRAELHVIREAGHFLQEDHGAQLGERIARWLQITPHEAAEQPCDGDSSATSVLDEIPPTPPGSHSALTFNRTIDRELVHKRSLDEVFVTDCLISDGSPGAIAVQLPRSHNVYCELRNGHHDLLLLLEAGRQAMTFFGHGGLEVPEDTAFVMASLQAEIVDLDVTRLAADPSQMTIHVPPGIAHYKRDRLRNYTMRGYGYIDKRPAIVFQGTAILIPSVIYERARRVSISDVPATLSAPVAVAPARVGRLDPRNVVVAEPEHGDRHSQCDLVVDNTHPCFFDHELDHVPGMLMLEAARQSAMLVLAGEGWEPEEIVLDRCRANLTQYAALWPPAKCVVTIDGDSHEPSDARCVTASFNQQGHDLGEISLRVRRVSASRR